MSFGINGPTQKFGIQEAQHMRNNGGGGNLGYFRRQDKDKKKKKDDDIDIFQLSNDEDEFVKDFEIEENSTILDKATQFVNLFKRPRNSA